MRARIFGAEKSTGPTAEEAGGILTIDLNALAANYRDLKKRAAPAACAAVVKADGYGLGLGPVAQALAGAGCTTFFVALIEEALRLRAALPTAAIYVLDGPPFFARSGWSPCSAPGPRSTNGTASPRTATSRCPPPSISTPACGGTGSATRTRSRSPSA
jgi:hypothetical protein